MSDGHVERKAMLVRKSRQTLLLQQIRNAGFDHIADRVVFLLPDESARLESAVRRLTPIGNEHYYTTESDMLREASARIATFHSPVVFCSDAGAFSLDQMDVPFPPGFLTLFEDQSGIARLDLAAGIKYGYCEGFYSQSWQGS